MIIIHAVKSLPRQVGTVVAKWMRVMPAVLAAPWWRVL
jgi:hypothetical protein